MDKSQKTILDNYNTNYEQTYSKIQTHEGLFALFKQRMINKDKEAIKVVTTPMFVTYPQEMKDKAFEDFYNFYSKYSFEKAEFELGEDSSPYFKISGLTIESNQVPNQKINFSLIHYEGLFHKINKYSIKNYYLISTSISSN